MRIDITSADVTPLAVFPLRWRWTLPQYNVLPLSAIASIHPLAPAKASEVWDAVRLFSLDLRTSLPGQESERLCESISSVSATTDEAASVGEWLQMLGIERDSTIVVS